MIFEKKTHGENLIGEAAGINIDGWNIQRLATEKEMRRVLILE